MDFVYNRLFCCNHNCYRVGIIYLTSASRYVTSASRYQSRSSMYIRGVITWNSKELAKAVPIEINPNTMILVWSVFNIYMTKPEYTL